MNTSRRTRCFIPRGDARLLAIGLKHAARQHGHDLPALGAALLVAAGVHRNQCRSADGSPYIVHPIQVATLVSRWGGNTEDVLAAILHDTAEDCAEGPDAMLDGIEQDFGPAVRQRVAAVTKNRGLDDRRQRAEDLLHRVTRATHRFGPGAAAIRLADRLHNCMTSTHFDAPALARLHAESALYVAPLARNLGLHAMAGLLEDGPRAWAAVAERPFLLAVLEIQSPWMQDGTALRKLNCEPVAARAGEAVHLES